MRGEIIPAGKSERQDDVNGSAPWRVIGGEDGLIHSADDAAQSGSKAATRATNAGGDLAVSVDAVAEYARALRLLGTDQQDRVVALETTILGWLSAKRGRSGSYKTWRAYSDTLASFRDTLKVQGLDLDGPVTPLALVAQAWAGAATDNGADPATSTYNQRLACVSSFYRYAIKAGILETNPIERVERRRVQAYAGAKALDAELVKAALAAIDRRTDIGARDYALLMIYLQTGRRLSEVAGLQLRDLEEQPGRRIRLTFRRGKGGKVLYDTLTPAIAAALRTYLHIIYGADLKSSGGEAPVWVSLAERNKTHGGHLSKVSISRICKARLGTTRVHALRHTMAHVMEQKGAPVSMIQQRLAHSSLATTGIYLAALRQDDNPFADQLADAFGAE